MGILDDAIREHLELKRQHGAGSDDIERLEKEAFGPLTRPGDPEFADSDEPPAEGDQGSLEAVEASSATVSGESSGDGDDWFSDEEETRVLRQESSPAEEAPAEQPDLADTAHHPAPAPADAEPSAASTEPPEAPERAIFDAEEIEFGDLDLDLEGSDEGTAAPRPAGSRLATGSDDLADFGADLELDLPDEAPAIEQPAVSQSEDPNLEEDDEDRPPAPISPRGEPPASGERSADSEEGAEDLLEETPDFLQDAPEGERLWFEQGEPKDFDFDED